MTTLALFITGWAAWGCLVNIPAWIRLLMMPSSKRAEWVRLGMVLHAVGMSFVLIALASAIWERGSLSPLILFSIDVPPAFALVFAGLIGLAETSFVWTSQLPKDPPVLGVSWAWLIYIVGTITWGATVLVWSVGGLR